MRMKKKRIESSVQDGAGGAHKTRQSEKSDHDQVQQLAQRISALSGSETEVARGWMSYGSWTSTDTYAVLRKSSEEAGSGSLDLYRVGDISPSDYIAGNAIEKQPFRTLTFQADDAVMVEEHGSSADQMKITGLKHYNDRSSKSPARKTMTFTPMEHHFSIKSVGK